MSGYRTEKVLRMGQRDLWMNMGQVSEFLKWYPRVQGVTGKLESKTHEWLYAYEHSMHPQRVRATHVTLSQANLHPVTLCGPTACLPMRDH